MGLALYRGHQRRNIVAHPLPPFIPSAQGQTWKDILTDEARDISQKENIICFVYFARNCENFTRAVGAVWAILYSFTHNRIIIDKNLFSFILLYNVSRSQECYRNGGICNHKRGILFQPDHFIQFTLSLFFFCPHFLPPLVLQLFPNSIHNRSNYLTNDKTRGLEIFYEIYFFPRE